MFELPMFHKYNNYLMRVESFLYKQDNVSNIKPSLPEVQIPVNQMTQKENKEIKEIKEINNLIKEENNKMNEIVFSSKTIEVQGEKICKGMILFYTIPDGKNISEQVTVELIGEMESDNYIILRKQNNELLAISDANTLSLCASENLFKDTEFHYNNTQKKAA